MKIYVILRPSDAINNGALSAMIAKKYSGDFYDLAKGQWLVASTKNIRELSADLGIEAGRHFGGTLVVEVKKYFGLHNKRVWQWMKRKGGEAQEDSD